jgi:hypothetical protein
MFNPLNMKQCPCLVSVALVPLAVFISGRLKLLGDDVEVCGNLNNLLINAEKVSVHLPQATL